MTLGLAAVSQDVTASVMRAIQCLALAGLEIAEPAVDLRATDACFRTLRAYQFAVLRRDALTLHRDKLKPEVIWNIEEGLKLTALALGEAEAARAVLRTAFLELLDAHEFLIAPTAPVAPFPVTDRYVTSIDGAEQETYLDWLALGYAITVMGCPAISIPCGFTAHGLPVGLQIIGKPYDEHKLLRMARWCEDVLQVKMDRPITPRKTAA